MRDMPLTDFGEARRRGESGEQYGAADAPSPQSDSYMGPRSWNSSAGSAFEEDEQALLWDDVQHESGHRRGNVTDTSSLPAMAPVPRIFRATWPSHWDHFMHFCRPAMDVYVWMAMVIFAVTSEPRANYDSWWAIYRGHSFLFLWLPFICRFCHGLLHFLISVAILPGPLLYHEGPLLRFYPKWLLENLKEHMMFREMHRPRLQHAGGITIQLVCPDGVMIDAMYFKGHNSSVSGPTAIRFNGNAEAFELQDELLPRIYTTNGINFLMFNYRGVGRSHWPKLFNNALAGHLYGLWSTPCICGTLLDAWTIVEYVIKELKVPPQQVVLIGHSIGGAIATELAARHPSLPMALCNSRSFANLSSVAIELAPAFFGLAPGSTKAKWMRWITRIALRATGWEYNSLRNWSRVRGFKWLEVSKVDHIIPHQHSLHAALVLTANGGAAVNGAGLRGGGGNANGSCGMSPRCIHLVNLEGMDNHNRMWLDTEIMQHISMVLEAVRGPVGAGLSGGSGTDMTPVVVAGGAAMVALEPIGLEDGSLEGQIVL